MEKLSIKDLQEFNRLYNKIANYCMEEHATKDGEWESYVARQIVLIGISGNKIHYSFDIEDSVVDVKELDESLKLGE